MKKLLLSLLAAFSIGAQAASVTVTVPGNTCSNLLLFTQSGAVTLLSVSVAATTATNVAVYAFDNYTNQLSYTNQAYTNISVYATNLIYSWTNYFGGTNSWTNMTEVAVSNVVAAATNLSPVRFSLAALANTTTTVNPARYVFNNGCWVTNTSTGTATITATYVQGN